MNLILKKQALIRAKQGRKLPKNYYFQTSKKFLIFFGRSFYFQDEIVMFEKWNQINFVIVHIRILVSLDD